MDALDKGDLLKFLIALCFFSCLFFLSKPVMGRVFSRRMSDRPLQSAMQTLGGEKAYQARVNVNGVPALLTVTGFDDPRGTVAKALLSQWLPSERAYAENSLYRFEKEGKDVTLLMLRPGRDATLLVMTLESSLSHAQRRAATPKLAEFPLPVFPGSAHGLQVDNEETGLHLLTLTTSAETTRVSSFYRQALTAAGWSPVFPELDATAGQVFLREQAWCMVMALPRRSDGETHITLLYKPLSAPR